MYTKSKVQHEYESLRLWRETKADLWEIANTNKEPLAATAQRVVDAYLGRERRSDGNSETQAAR